ncbi:glycerophosphodiester phosphodiesterase family protein [Jeotgalicoccus halotolerans]|uniref:glycerophosphodiester phosphodiesterase n=1 Tax=Jeotgalicoccus halotolerans TaxID=157227 RepID=UPI003519B185
MKRFAIIVTFLIILSFGMTATFSVISGGDTDESRNKIMNIAHRGASGYAPENTLAAFDKAVEMQADYIEIDVQLSKDDLPVVIHDDTLDRTTNGTGNISAHTFQELRSLDAGSWFDKDYAGEKIPSLNEVLEMYGEKINILIELKSPELYPGVEEKVAEALAKYKLDTSNNIVIQSFNHPSVIKSAEMLPEITHGVLAGENYKNVTDQQLQEFAAYAEYFNPNLKIVSSELVDKVHQAGMKISPYTIKTKAEAERIYKFGVDGLITDYPDYAEALKE